MRFKAPIAQSNLHAHISTDQRLQKVRMIRRLLSEGLYRSGLLQLSSRVAHNSLPILTVHSVIDTDSELPWMPLRSYLSANALKENLQFLQKYYTFITLNQAVRILSREEPPIQRAIVLTFDDGYMNNFRTALPILAELQIPATFYVVPAFIKERTPFWFDRLDYAIQKNVGEQSVVDVIGRKISLDPTSRNSMRSSLISIFKLVMQESLDDRKLGELTRGISEQIEELRGDSLLSTYGESDPCAIVTEAVLQHAAKNPLVEIGSHTNRHLRLSRLDNETAKRELADSSDAIETMTGNKPKTFCYPNGYHDRRTAGLVAESGYLAGLTTLEGRNRIGASNLHALRRINWSVSASPEELFALTSGLYRDSYLPRKTEVVDESTPPARSGKPEEAKSCTGPLLFQVGRRTNGKRMKHMSRPAHF